MSLSTSPAVAAVQPLTDPAWHGFLDPSMTGFVSTMVFPVVNVSVPTGAYNVWDRESVQRDVAAIRAPGGEAAHVERSASKQTFTCLDYAHAEVVTDFDRATYGGSDYVDQARMMAMATVLRAMDIAWTNKCFTTSVWDTDNSAPSTTWDDAASDPIKDVGKQIDDVEGVLDGAVALKGVCSQKVFRALSRHPDVMGQRTVLGLDPRKPATREQVAEALGLDELIVGSGKRVTTVKGASSQTTAAIFGKHFLVLGVSPSAAQSGGPTAGRTHLYKPVSVREAAPSGRRNQGDLDVIAEGEVSFDIVSGELGSFRSDCIA